MTTDAVIELVPRCCPVCGSADESRVFADATIDFAQWNAFTFASRKAPDFMHYRIIECPVCDVLYSNPIPTLDTLASAYRDAGYDSGEEARFAAATYGSHLPAIAAALPDRRGALDIGAGDGAFLDQLLGCNFSQVIGVEPSSAPIAAADERVRPLLRQGFFRAEDFTPGSLSLISCFQTIEHVYEPLTLCREAYELLKPGGALFLIGHNRRALSARVLGTRSPIFDVEHLQIFSPRSMTQLLQRAGFRNVRVKIVVNCYPIHYFLKLAPLPAGVKRKVMEGRIMSRFGNLPLSVPLGNISVVGFKG